MLAKLAASAMNRRRLLFGLASASVAAAVPAASALAAVEDADLLRLGDMLPDLAADHRAAKETRKAIVEEWGPRWPRAPEILRGGAGDMERDLTGRGIPVVHPISGREQYFALWYADMTTERLEYWTKALRRRKVEGSRQHAIDCIEYFTERRDAAIPYDAECQRIRDLSGYDEAHRRFRDAEQALIDHIFAILEREAATMAGVVIQAQAVAAGSDISLLSVVLAEATSHRNRGEMLAASLLRIAGGVAA